MNVHRMTNLQSFAKRGAQPSLLSMPTKFSSSATLTVPRVDGRKSRTSLIAVSCLGRRSLVREGAVLHRILAILLHHYHITNTAMMALRVCACVGSATLPPVYRSVRAKTKMPADRKKI